MNASNQLSERSPFDQRNNLDFTPKRTEKSWTDHRIEQIKKKYETTQNKTHWPGSQIRTKNIIQDKENQKKVPKTQYKEQKNEFPIRSPSIQFMSKCKNIFQSQKIVTKTNEKEGQSSLKAINSNSNDKQRVSAFQTQDNFCIKSALNQKFQAQSSQKIRYLPSILLPTQYCLMGKLRDSNPKISKREVNDHRIENIEKINCKIKHLLQSIESCEQQELRLTNASRIVLSRSRIDRYNLDRSSISKVQFKNSSNLIQLQQTKIIQRRSFNYPTATSNAAESNDFDKSYQQPSKDSAVRINKSPNHFQDYMNEYKEKLNDHKSRVQERIAAQNQTAMLRASSCTQRGRKYQLSQDNKESINKENSGQIDLQIRKFRHKIQQLQQKKRKMNIQFKPFQFQYSPIQKISKKSQVLHPKLYPKLSYQRLKTQVQRPSSLIQKQNFQREKFGFISKLEDKQNIQLKAIYLFVKDSIYPQKVTLRQPNELSKLAQHSKSIIQNIENAQKQSIVINDIDTSNKKSYDNEELRKKIGERMESRKKMLEIIQNKISQEQEDVLQSQKFIKSLCRQVCLDQDLRNSKNWLSQYNNPSKYQLIKSQLAKKKVYMCDEEIGSEFMTTNDIENDPFFSFREEKYTINTVVSSYLDSISFWQQQLLKKWNIQKVLKDQSLSVTLLKNEILIEDIVRLINTQSGNFYRNRDVYLIFERIKKYLGIKGQESISFEQLKQVFGK